jgi:hypothetical protein
MPSATPQWHASQIETWGHSVHGLYTNWSNSFVCTQRLPEASDHVLGCSTNWILGTTSSRLAIGQTVKSGAHCLTLCCWQPGQVKDVGAYDFPDTIDVRPGTVQTGTQRAQGLEPWKVALDGTTGRGYLDKPVIPSTFHPLCKIPWSLRMRAQRKTNAPIPPATVVRPSCVTS